MNVEAQLGGRVQGLEIRSSAPGGELMHLKGYCVDHRLFRTGSANFSRSGETRQDNDLVALRGASSAPDLKPSPTERGAILRTRQRSNISAQPIAFASPSIRPSSAQFR
jgi:phosphatidylserine/phosphatidylglycerophosphate/cardiolipin synthase-like enzyme